jgi:hypothetical protein
MENMTFVNVALLGDLVESIYEKVKTHAQNHELEIILPGGFQELVNRYIVFAAMP